MEITREQFDEYTGYLKHRMQSGDPEVREELRYALKHFKEMFPEFAEPKFRRCVVFSEATPYDTAERKNTTPFQIVCDDEGFYVVGKDGSIVIASKEYFGFITIGNHEKAQQVLSFLKGGEE